MYIEDEIVYAVVFLWAAYGLHMLMKIQDERRLKKKKEEERYNVKGYYRKQFYPKENIHRTIYVEGHSRHFNPYDNGQPPMFDVRGEEE